MMCDLHLKPVETSGFGAVISDLQPIIGWFGPKLCEIQPIFVISLTSFAQMLAKIGFLSPNNKKPGCAGAVALLRSIRFMNYYIFHSFHSFNCLILIFLSPNNKKPGCVSKI